MALAALALLPAAAAAAPADAGGDENTDITVPPAGKLYGFSGIRQVDGPSPATAAKLIAGVNGNASRTTLHWQALEPERDVWHEGRFDRYETLYAALRAKGIEPIFVLQFAPAWARDPGTPQECGASDSCHYPPAPEMLGEWAEFVTEIARRFPAAAIEVWNEPNYQPQWQSGVDPARYAQLLAVADAAAAAVDPSIPVYPGGLGTALRSDGLAASDFLNRAYAASPSLKDHADAINLHLYPGNYLGPDSSFAKTFTNVRAVRAAYGDDDKPILVSEIGATTTGPDGVTEAQQADLLRRVRNKILSMPDTLGVLVYTLTDQTAFAASDPERGYGALEPIAGLFSLLRPKDAYCTLSGGLLDLVLGLLSGDCPDPVEPEPDPDPDPEPDPLPEPDPQPLPDPEPEPEPAPDIEPAPAPVLTGISLKARGGAPRLVRGGRPVRVRFAVRARGDAGAARRVRVCLVRSSRGVRARGRRCRSAGPVGAGGRTSVSLRLKLTRGARGRKASAVIKARAGRLHARTRLRISTPRRR